MTLREVLLPLFAEVILTFALLFWMAFLRTRAITSGATETRDIALREPGWRSPSPRSPTRSTISSSCRCCSTC